ncbi:ribosome hibernation-promoting factor, HPF/YfiA family [Luedemannella helvata]|uniref:Ribosome hibernation promoting factor n=1 Tax=Luedemannella helvata TaxID=349315 RepID=A0ABN2K0D6_9ACTN
MDIVVKGLNVEVPDHYRQHVADKLHKIERYDQKIIRTEVELFHERNPRQSDNCQRVEITCLSRGPVVRAEACAADFYTALDNAVSKLEGRMRRAADRRRVHRGRRAPVSVAEATAPLAGELTGDLFATPTADQPDLAKPADEQEVDDQPWHIAREKVHPAEPMTIDDALFEMELVGHDFYLFFDKETSRPSVVYRRRKGYDYGVISLSEWTGVSR